MVYYLEYHFTTLQDSECLIHNDYIITGIQSYYSLEISVWIIYSPLSKILLAQLPGDYASSWNNLSKITSEV